MGAVLPLRWRESGTILVPCPPSDGSIEEEIVCSEQQVVATVLKEKKTSLLVSLNPHLKKDNISSSLGDVSGSGCPRSRRLARTSTAPVIRRSGGGPSCSRWREDEYRVDDTMLRRRLPSRQAASKDEYCVDDSTLRRRFPSRQVAGEDEYRANYSMLRRWSPSQQAAGEDESHSAHRTPRRQYSL